MHAGIQRKYSLKASKSASICGFGSDKDRRIAARNGQRLIRYK